MSEQLYCILDFETRSKAPIKLVGGFEYAAHPSTEILSVAWRVGTRETLRQKETQKWCVKLYPNSKKRKVLAEILRNPRIRIVAQNSIFEQLITQIVWPRQLGDHLDIPLSRWVCTASMSAAHALPRDLEKACKALGLKAQKNPIGKKLIRKHSIPQKLSKKQTTIWNDDPDGLTALTDYCGEDVDATVELFLTLPPLTPSEREGWKRNQRINKRGIYIDRKLVKSALKLIDIESKRLNSQTRIITDGQLETANQRNAVLAFLAENGLKLPNLQKKTVEDALSSGHATGVAAKLLRIRQAISKTSTAKYEGFEARTRFDSRLRDFSFWHGASTGRDTGQGVQIHNLTKPTIDDVPFAIEVLRHGDHEWAFAMLEDIMEALASSTRGVIAATPGHELYCADLNAIEVRVLFWLAGHEKGLQMFRDGEDLYKDQATEIYDKILEAITDPEREVGKRVVLGGGFGMGPPKFAETCKTFGTPVTLALAKRAIKAYRTKHAPVPAMWENLERAAIAATRNPGKVYAVNKTKWFVKRKFLYCELPSGRRLAYFGPSVRMRKTPWGTIKPELHHWGVHPKTKQWVSGGTYGGRLTENVVQAVARDVMVVGQENTERAGYTPLHSVYDELIHERAIGTGGSVEEFERLMISPMPAWTKGLPLKAKGWAGKRYRK